MSDTLSETVACDLLARLFRSRGYAIERNVPFREYGVEFHIDGWDPRARVGFEFLSSEDDDHDDLSLAEYQTLSTAQQRGELSLFILDEVEPLSAAELTAAARDFLDEAADAARARAAQRARGGKKVAAAKAAPAKKPRADRGTAAARRPADRKPAAKKNTGRKTTARKTTAKKPAAKKPVPKKPVPAKQLAATGRKKKQATAKAGRKNHR